MFLWLINKFCVITKKGKKETKETTAKKGKIEAFEIIFLLAHRVRRIF